MGSYISCQSSYRGSSYHFEQSELLFPEKTAHDFYNDLVLIHHSRFSVTFHATLRKNNQNVVLKIYHHHQDWKDEQEHLHWIQNKWSFDTNGICFPIGSFSFFDPRDWQCDVRLDKSLIGRSGLVFPRKPYDLFTIYPSLQLDELLSVWTDIAFYLDALHKMNVEHFDVKPDNILLDSERQVWLIDFHMCELPTRRHFSQIRGTFFYIAPEIVYSNKSIIFGKADVWSFGMMLWITMSRLSFLPDSDFAFYLNDLGRILTQEEYQQVVQKTRKMTCKLGLLLRQMLELDATKRINMNQVYAALKILNEKKK